MIKITFKNIQQKKWKTVKLGDHEYFSRIGGKTPKRSVKEFWEKGNMVWITTSELDSGKINYVKDSKEKINSTLISQNYIIPKNSILLSCTASLGKVGIAECEITSNQQFNSFHIKKDILPKFLAYYFLTLKNTLLKMSGDSVFPHLTISQLEKIPIPIPPIITQKKIIQQFDSIKKLELKKKTNLILLEELTNSVFLDLFGEPFLNPKKWQTKMLNEILVCPLKHGKSISGIKVKNELGKIPLLKLGALTENGLDPNQIKYYDDSLENLEEHLLQPEDILVSRSNTTDLVGRIGRYSGNPKNCLVSDLMIVIRIKSNILLPIFAEHYLRRKKVRQFLKNRARGTSGSMQKISNKDIKDIEMFIPPMEVQQKFVKQLNQLNLLREKSSYDKIKLLYEYLSRKVFNDYHV